MKNALSHNHVVTRFHWKLISPRLLFLSQSTYFLTVSDNKTMKHVSYAVQNNNNGCIKVPFTKRDTTLDFDPIRMSKMIFYIQQLRSWQ